MTGISNKQKAMFAVMLLALAGTAAGILTKQWQVAALGALVSFAIGTILIFLTLVALTRSMELIRKRLRNIDPRSREMAAGIRRLDRRTAERFKALEATEARLERAERRLLATLETQRFHLQDELASLQELHSHSVTAAAEPNGQ